MSNTVTFAEEHIENKFNDSQTTEKVAIHIGTVAEAAATKY